MKMSEIHETGRRPLHGATIEEYTVGSWCPSNDGSGLPTAVALELKVDGLPPLVMRLKSAKAVDDMVAALLKHRRDVWPYAAQQFRKA